MKNKKKFIPYIIAGMVFASGVSVYYNTSYVMASTQPTIVLNDSTFVPHAPIEIYNGRMLVPFREFGEAIGAQVIWEPQLQKITMLRESNYSIMVIGETTIQYGNFTLDGDGGIIFETKNIAHMDAPAVIINNLTYVPIRALSETLGVNVDWNYNTSTAFVNSTNTGGSASVSNQGQITAQRASEIALAQTNGGTVREIERYVRPNGQIVYEIVIISGSGMYEIYIDGATGQVLKFELMGGARPSTPPVNNTPPNNSGSNQVTTGEITAQRASEIALAQTNGGTVREVERYVRPNGQIVYEIEIRNRGFIYEVYVDGRTGAVLKVEREGFWS